MHYLIDRLTCKMDISQEQAEAAVGALLSYIAKQLNAAEMQRIFDRFPRAKDLVSQAESHETSGLLGGLASPMSSPEPLLAALSEMTSKGLSIEEIQEVARETVDFARERVGDHSVEELLEKVPGLRQII
ncbi:DUF2780 domain-containing protein [Polycladidibacter hongkongensis]|uniref:DUF2780 domain-containing protein n=1 Tax=Polycladidibacter hongkongensis TaxID=1647556 RepID=UPI0008351D41|nr:DUF2780 domain-containing protein [Pseudovibrio hongkongensis]